MNWILELMRQPAASRLGEVLLHFLWQGGVVAALLALTLAALRRASPNVRYWTACAALLSLTVLPMVTGFWLASSGPPVAPPHTRLVPTDPTVTSSPFPTPNSRVPGWLEPGLPCLTLAWLLGASLCGARLLGGWWQAQRLTRGVTRLVASPWPETLRELALRFGVHRTVALLESVQVQTPLVLGWLKPVILLPVGLVAGLSPAQVSALLAHELAHLRRHDYLINLLQCVVESLLFYHPAVWWISRRIRIERELCCDDLAVYVLNDRRVLAEALVTLAERESATFALSLGADGGSLTDRVRRLLQEPSLSPAPSRLGYLLTLLLAFGLGAGGLWLGQRGFNRKQALPAAAPKLAGLDALERQLVQLDDRIGQKQNSMDQLRLELKIPDVVAEGGSIGTVMGPEVERMRVQRNELEARINESREEIRQLKEKDSRELRYALNAARPTPLLAALLGDLTIAEQQKANLNPELGPKHPDVERVNTVINLINAQADNVVRGIINSLETKLEADQARLDQIRKLLEESLVEQAALTVRYRPYLREKRDLDTLLRMREALFLQVAQERINAVVYVPAGR